MSIKEEALIWSSSESFEVLDSSLYTTITADSIQNPATAESITTGLGGTNMNFIASVFGSNLFIIFTGFIYLWIAIFMWKFWLPGAIKHAAEPFAFVGAVLWPAGIPIYVTFKLCWYGIPFIYKIIEKTVPDVKFTKKDKD